MRGGLPKYIYIHRILQTRLERELTPGSRIPSEAALCADFGVSRATIQQALNLLETNGLIRREQGRGTFYLGNKTPRMEQKPSELLESIIKFKEGTTTQLVHRSIRQPLASVAERLQVPPDCQIVYLERVGVVEGEPIVFIYTYLPHDIGLRILESEAGLERMSIASLLEDKHGIHVESVRQVISASLADPSFAEHLDIDPGSAVLEGQRTYYDRDERPIFCTTSFYRADRHCFVVTLKEWR